MLVFLLGMSASLFAEELDFARDVLPILEKHCIECHGAETQESHLRLDSMVHALRGGDSGSPAIVPGDSQSSYLIERVTSSNPKERMPPEKVPLSDSEQQLLRLWIDRAEMWDAALKDRSVSRSEHWSFQPRKRPSIPNMGASPLRNPIPGDSKPVDFFIEARLAEAGLAFSPPAERRILIRRLYLVMLGLPPSPDEIETFINDASADAWERLVDRVLNNPRYGERWASYWLDLIHFGETNGYETNRERLDAFPYRDWVILAFNTDKPYDDFVREQIAGDALGEPVGTGFLVAGPNDIVKGQDPLLNITQRQDELADMVNTTGTAFLGLTTGCARCHNHKFDPMTQSDYYSMQAVFAGVEHASRELPLSTESKTRLTSIDREIEQLRAELAPYEVDRGTREPVTARENVENISPIEAQFLRFTIEKTNASEPCIDELEVFSNEENIALASRGTLASSSGDFVHELHKLAHLNDGEVGNARSWIAKKREGSWAQLKFPKVHRIDKIVWGRDRQGKYADRLAIAYRIEVSLDGTEWTQVASAADRKPFQSGKEYEREYAVSNLPEVEASKVKRTLKKLESLGQERKGLQSQAKVYAGQFVQPGKTHRLHRGDPTSPREAVAPGAIRFLETLGLKSDTPEQQRRLALANWIASPDNPLTARVLVNRLWQFHYGTGIVDTPSDFGANGTLPSHPDLLDWLACELVDHDWSIKHLHKLILQSKTWCQTSLPNENSLRVDASTRLLWRFPPRRLEAEGIRDCMLHASGVLDLKMGGPGFSAFEVELENVRHYFPKKDYGPVDWRRMIYMTKVRQEKDSIFGVFDCPDGSQVTPKRSRSTTPLQALNLLNSTFVLQQAERFSERLHRERETNDGRVELAYELCFGRRPTQLETATAIQFIDARGWVPFARALLNSNEFVFIP